MWVDVPSDKKETSVYELVVGKGGPKLTPNVAESGPLGIETRKIGGGAVLKATRKPLGELAKMLANQLDTFVVDETGLTGTFDFTLEWSIPQVNGDTNPNAPSIFTAMIEQLGLKLDPQKAPIEHIVIDSAAMPDEN